MTTRGYTETSQIPDHAHNNSHYLASLGISLQALSSDRNFNLKEGIN